MPASSHLPAGSVNATVAIVSPLAMPGRWACLAASSPDWISVLAASTTVEKNGADSRAPTHLLEHDAELDVAEARAAVLLGDVQALEAHLLGHLRHTAASYPASVSICSRTAASALLASEEGAHGVAQLVLFVGEGEVHGATMDVAAAAPTQLVLRTLAYT